jgi:hypothetical protein
VLPSASATAAKARSANRPVTRIKGLNPFGYEDNLAGEKSDPE